MDSQKLRILTVKSRKDFVDIYRKGESYSRPTVILQKRKTPEKYIKVDERHRAENFCRFGITVTKKITKVAVHRNRIRRQLRALMQGLLAKHGENHTDYVVVARKFALGSDFKRLQKDLEKCFKELSTSIES